jgi:hypothetical protein
MRSGLTGQRPAQSELSHYRRIDRRLVDAVAMGSSCSVAQAAERERAIRLED